MKLLFADVIPLRTACRPVKSAARDGVHTGEPTRCAVNLMPDEASASMCGVGSVRLPYALRSP